MEFFAAYRRRVRSSLVVGVVPSVPGSCGGVSGIILEKRMTMRGRYHCFASTLAHGLTRYGASIGKAVPLRRSCALLGGCIMERMVGK